MLDKNIIQRADEHKEVIKRSAGDAVPKRVTINRCPINAADATHIAKVAIIAQLLPSIADIASPSRPLHELTQKLGGLAFQQGRRVCLFLRNVLEKTNRCRPL